MSYDNTNSGILAKNRKKEKDSHPDHTGSVNADGVEYWMSAWIKEGKPGSKLEGQKYFSIALTRKDGQQSQRTTTRSIPDSSYDEDIPF